MVCWLADFCGDVPAHRAFVCVNRKLAKKRKDVNRTTGQEMTDMGNSMDHSYADQSTLHRDDSMAVTFVETHNYNNRCRFTKEATIAVVFSEVVLSISTSTVAVLTNAILILNCTITF